MEKIYDQAYFDFWYRDPQREEEIQHHLQHKVAVAIAVAEYHLGHPVRSVLDVGCGEGAWRALLRKLRPELEYIGLDGSEYAVQRYGASRNLHRMRFGELAQLAFDEPVDLLICADMMHYVADEELERGLAAFANLCDGVAWLEVFCREDAVEGDYQDYYQRDAAWYRQRFSQAGFHPCGNHCYLSQALVPGAMALELL